MTDLKATVGKAKRIIEKIEAAQKPTVLVVISPHTLDDWVAFKLNNVLRSMGNMERIDVLLESRGGSIDMAYKMLTLLGSYSGQVRVVVPFLAKSAAALIALGANNLVLCRAGELGPIDPQVVDPQTGAYVPAHSIKETMDFIAEIKDAVTRISLTEKIPLLLIGAYRGAEKTSRQYLDEILTKKGFDGDKKNELLEVFTKKFFSHGYPMNRDFLTRSGIHLDEIGEPIEAWFADLHATWQEYLHSINPQAAQNALILQTKEVESISIPQMDNEMVVKPDE